MKQPQRTLIRIHCKLKAYGIVTDRKSVVIRRFSADLDTSWKGNIDKIDEDFFFDDGEIDKRVRTIEKNWQRI